MSVARRINAGVLVCQRLLLVALVLVFCNPALGEVFYTFASDEGGGVAVLDADPATGEVRRHEVLFREPAFTKTHKLAVSEDGQTIVMVNESPENNVAIITLEQGKTVRSQVVSVAGVPDELRVFGRHALIGADKGHLSLVNLDTGVVEKAVNTRKLLDPPGHKVEHIKIANDHSYAVVSLQKDQAGQKSLGNRLVLLKLPTLEVIHDLQLPRSKPQLHNAHNDKEQGPGPEVIVISPQTNRLMVTMDFYGGVAITDLDEALAGRQTNMTYLSTAIDESWGTAFPDRLCVIPRPQQQTQWVMVFNVGDAGGGAMIDLAGRSVVARFNCPHGLETPTYLPTQQLVVASHAGKHKDPTEAQVVKTYDSSGQVFVFDVSSLDRLGEPRIIEVDGPVNRLAPLDAAASPLVAVVFGEPYVKRNAPDRSNLQQHFAVINAQTGQTLATFPAHGEPRRLMTR